MEMKAYALWSLLLFSFLFFAPRTPPQQALVDSPPTVILTDEQGEYPLGLFVEVLQDPSRELTISQVTSSEYAAQFVPSEKEVPNFGYTTSAIWLRFRVRNETSQTCADAGSICSWRLGLMNARLGLVDLYLPTPSGWQHKQAGRRLPFAAREVRHPKFIFKVHLPTGAEQTIYLRLAGQGSIFASLTLWSPDKFAEVVQADSLVLGALFGALLVMAGYNGFLFLSLRTANYLYLTIFILTVILFMVATKGFGHQYLWPGGANQYGQDVGRLLTIFWCLIFTISFLQSRRQAPRLHKLLLILIAITLLFAVLLVPFFSLITRAISILLLLIPLSIGVTAFVVWRRGAHSARFYLLGWLAPIVIVFLAGLANLGLFNAKLFSFHGFFVSSVLMVLLFSLALADQMNLLKRKTEQANRELRANERRLNQYLEAMPVGVTVHGRDGKPHYINRQAQQIFGLSLPPSPPEGIRTLIEAISDFPLYVAGRTDKYPLNSLPLMQALAGQSATADDIEVQLPQRNASPSGKRTCLEVWSSPIFDEEERVQYAISAFQDITERKEAQAELEQYRLHLEELVAQRTASLRKAKSAAEEAKSAAEEANQAKSRFLANMSHELRTPLNAILGYARLLQRTYPNIKRLQIVEQSGKHLLMLISDVLDLAKIEAGKIELHLSTFHLPTFLQQIKQMLTLQAHQKGLVFHYQPAVDPSSVRASLPTHLYADQKRLRQVLLNLLGNAVKFTPHACVGKSGEVRFSVTRLEETKEGVCRLRFEVSDSGIGIAPEDLSTIFKPFEQLGSYQEGTGLGLTISRRLVSLMGGELSVKSQLGEGSTFWFEVPLTIASHSMQKAPQAWPIAVKGQRLKSWSSMTSHIIAPY